MHQWFMYIFENRMNQDGFVYCFECGKPMHESTYKGLTTCYSHILAKTGKYKEHAGNPDNVKIVHPDCHNLYTMHPKQAINQYNEFLKLKQLHYGR